MSPISLSKDRPAFTVLSDDQNPYIIQTTEDVRTQTTKLVNINIVRPIQRKTSTVRKVLEVKQPDLQNEYDDYDPVEFVRELDNKLRRLQKARMVEEQLQSAKSDYNFISNEPAQEAKNNFSQNFNGYQASYRKRRNMTRRQDKYERSPKTQINGDNPENGRIVKSKDWMRQKMITRKTPINHAEVLLNHNHESDISDEELAEKHKFSKQLDERLSKISNKNEYIENLSNSEILVNVKDSNKEDLKIFLRGEAIIQNDLNIIDERHLNSSYDDLQSITSARDLHSRNLMNGLEKNSKQHLTVTNKVISNSPKIIGDSLKVVNVVNDRDSEEFISRESNLNANSADRSPNSRNTFYKRPQRKTRALVILEQSRPPFVTVVPTGVFLSPEPPYINNEPKNSYHYKSPRDMRKTYAYESKPRILGTVESSQIRTKRNVFPQNKATDTRRETTRYITAKSPAELNNKFTEKNVRRYVDTSRISDTKRWNRNYNDNIAAQSDVNNEMQKVSVYNTSVINNNLLGVAAEKMAKISAGVAGVKE